MDARLQFLKTSDNIKLYYELWAPDRAKALIIFIHGLGDHLGRYADFARHFIQRDYGICLFDMRGHGKSGGRRTHCRSFIDFFKDLSLIIEMAQKSYGSLPLFLVGHSFGAQIAVNFAARYSKGLRGLVALSPNIEPIVKIPEWKKRLAGKLSGLIPIIRFHSKINPVFFSHDANVVEAAREDPLMKWNVTARLGTEILKNTEQLPRLAFQVKIPCLFMQGGDDRITSIEATRKFYHSILIQNKDFKSYAGLYHELLQETEKNRIYNDIEIWLNTQLVSSKRLAKAGAEDSYVSKTPDLWQHFDHSRHFA
jgi:alpha-beta hydrolase superfamily lysophospholipase